MPDLAEQLTEVFRSGLASNPGLRVALSKALGSLADEEAAEPAEPEEPDTQVSKTEAEYRTSETDSERCGKCEHYKPGSGSTGTCDLVSGRIEPDFVCDYFHSADSDRHPTASHNRNSSGGGYSPDGAG